MSSDKLEPSGLGGWLILPSLHLIASIGFTLFNLLIIFTPDSMAGMEAIFAENSEFASIRLTIIVSIGMGLIYLPFAIYCAFNFFTKKSNTRKLMIVFYGISFIIAAIEIFFAQPMQEALNDDTLAVAGKNFVRAIIACSIWIPYFLVSVRVQNTFNPDTSEAIGQVFE